MYELTELIIELEVYGAENKTIRIPFRIYSQQLIDFETLKYISAEDYFEKNKEEIKEKIEKSKEKFGLIMNPIGMDLKRIYIKKGLREYKALFQTYSIVDSYQHQNVSVSLDSLIKKNLFNGFAIILYELDKKALEVEGYQSLFKNCPQRIIDMLELGILTKEMIEELWKHLKRDPDLSAIIRYFLSKKSKEKFQIDFQEIIKYRTQKPKLAKEERKILTPYND